MTDGRDDGGLVGREDELAAARDAIAAVRAGGSRVLIVSGEPGIGKSALLDVVRADAAAAGLTVLAGRATEHETEVPFGLTIDALDDHVDDLDLAVRERLDRELGGVLPACGDAGDAPRTAAQRFRVHRALRELTEALAGARGVALVLDDLHWADDASREWVAHLLRRPPRCPHLLVLALRPVAPLGLLLDAVRSGVPSAHLALAPLTDAPAATLLAQVAEARRPALLREAAGNPLFLTELARVGAHAERLPPTIVAAVELEVAAVAPEARALLEAAAVAGDPFDVDLAASAAAMERSGATAALDALVAADLVRPEPGRAGVLRFRHPLVRRAVYDATAPGARRAAHERAAATLAARGVGPTGLAHHVERVARVGDAEAAATLHRAARDAAPRAPGTAARWLRAALDLTPGAPAAERADTLAELAASLTAAGRQHDAHAALDEALAILPADDVERRLRLTAALASVDHVLGRHADALARLTAELEELPSGVSDRVRALVRFELATACVYVQDVDALALWAGRAAPVLRESDPATALCDDALVLIGRRWLGRTEGLEERRAELLGRLAALPPALRRTRTEIYVYLGQAEALAQNNASALRLAEDGLAAIRAGGNDAMLVALTSLQVQVALGLGDARRGREGIAVAEEAARLQDADFGLAYTLAARAELARLDGDREDADRAADEWPRVARRIGDVPLIRTGETAFAMLLAADDPARAARLLREHAGERFDRIEPEFSTTRVLPAYVRASLSAGERDEAARAAALLDERAAFLGLPLTRAAAALAHAEVALADDDAAAALAGADDAATAAAEHDHGELRFHADVAAARALGTLDRREDAVARLRAAADRATAVAAWALRDAAGSELRRLGSRLPAALRVAGEDGGLTDREAQVAELVAGGRSNKEVAGMLYLSPKTVEHTLSRVYAKLGVRSRTELAAARRLAS